MLLRTDLFRDADRLTTRAFDTATRTTGARLDAWTDGDVFVIEVDLPGVDPTAVEVTVDRRVLTIRAERRRTGAEGVRRLIAERPMGTVSRQVFLSDTLDTDRLEAGYDAGVLTVRIPVTERAKPRRIEVAAGSADRQTPDGQIPDRQIPDRQTTDA